MMAQKCVHRGCEKMFTDPHEECVYHPGPPDFHEGLKGWKCCKPRVLTFDEFMTIPPCTTGVHSTTDSPPQLEKKAPTPSAPSPSPSSDAPERRPITTPQNAPSPAPAPAPVEEDDDPSSPVPVGKVCRRKACGAVYQGEERKAGEEAEKCVHHPGVPIFHEGSKGYSCCKRRVLDFDDFMKIGGCTTKPLHLFSDTKPNNNAGAAGDGEEGVEVLVDVRSDFYQTATSVIASFFLKKIDKSASTISFGPQSVSLDLKTSDATPKVFRKKIELFGPIDAEGSEWKVLGTKLELSLVKADGSAWPVLRRDEKRTGEIIQVGRAGNLRR